MGRTGSVRGRSFAGRVCRTLGIGMIPVDLAGVEGMTFPPKLNRSVVAHYILDSLCPEQKTILEAGSSQGWRVTPFRQTCREVHHPRSGLARFDAQEPMDGLQHHYASD